MRLACDLQTILGHALHRKVALLSEILRVGRNCWRREHATRISFLVDADSYFRTLRDALLRAREQVLVLGWDMDGRLRLRRDEVSDDAPVGLRELLNFVVARQPSLHVHVLLWDFAILYALEREPVPTINLKLRTDKRVHVSLDSSAPFGASRHEKIVVIDDRLAFCGGIDITENRWDTPEHALDDPRRTTSRGRPYAPFHDVQMAVEGDAAAALGDHCRTRIRIATGEQLEKPTRHSDPWPESLDTHVKSTSVAVVRTLRDEDTELVDEVERLYLDTIASARDYVYIENQYFTSRTIATAIAERLQAQEGPEFVLVMPDQCSGWLEQQTMGLLRDRLIEELQEADVHGRLGVFTPALDEDGEHCVMVHAKLLVADDRFVRIGSSNLTRRSFAMDSECDLAIEAGDKDDPASAAMGSFCDRLLAEHLGANVADVERMRAESGSMLATIEALGDSGRHLAPLHVLGETDPAMESVVATISDPGDPIEGETVLEEFRDKVIGDVSRFSGVPALLSIAVAALVLALAWRYTPLAGYVDVQAVLAWLDDSRSSHAAPLILLILYLVAGVVVFPITIVNVATAIAFGPWLGFCYGVAGSLASALLTFAIGRRLGSRAVQRISSGLAYRAVKAVGKRGFLAVLSCRVVPVAPFSVINVVAGAMPIGLRDYVLGTIVGMAPGIAVLAAFGDRILKLLNDPSPVNLVVLVAIMVLWLGLGWGFSRLLESPVEKL